MSINMFAQSEGEILNIFVRVYDLEGRKIGKGKILSVTDSTLNLKRKNKTYNFSMSKIGYIRTKRSAGNNVLIGAAATGTALATLGGASGGTEGGFISFSAEDLAVGGLVVGSVFGAGIGGITAIFKNSKAFEINGKKEKFEAFREAVGIKKE